jgi:phospholipase C
MASKKLRNSESVDISRRQFVKTTAAASGALMFGSAGSLLAKTQELPKPNKSGIEHIVLVTMENRSFDHFLGWLPDGNGRQGGLSFTDTVGNAYPLTPWPPTTQVVDMPIPTIPIQVAGSNTTTGSAMVG